MSQHLSTVNATLSWHTRLDARWFQIFFLLSFLTIGIVVQGIELTPAQLMLTLCAGLATQTLWLFAKVLPARHQFNSYLSAVITALGVCILVRSPSYWVHPGLLVVAISSKFLLRAGPASTKSHIYNPANLAAFLVFAVLPDAWLSPGQWGSTAALALLFLALGGVVTGRIGRWQTSAAFLAMWGTLLACRLVWLETDPQLSLHIWWQQMANGATLLFAFFMISDPMTTPQGLRPRVLYVVIVALAAFVWQFVFYKPHGLIVALFVLSPLVPLLNWRWPKERFDWHRTG